MKKWNTLQKITAILYAVFALLALLYSIFEAILTFGGENKQITFLVVLNFSVSFILFILLHGGAFVALALVQYFLHKFIHDKRKRNSLIPITIIEVIKILLTGGYFFFYYSLTMNFHTVINSLRSIVSICSLLVFVALVVLDILQIVQLYKKYKRQSKNDKL